MKRKWTLALLLATCLVLGACNSPNDSTGSQANQSDSPQEESSEPTDEKVVIKLAHEEAPGCAQDVYAHKFAEIINEKSNGQIEVQVYSIGQIGSDQDLLQLLQTGGIQMSISTPSISSTMIPEAQIFDLHFIFTDDMDKNNEILKTSTAINEMLSGVYESKGIKVGGYWSEGYMSMTSNKEIDELSDMQGFKIRTMQSPLLISSYKSYGANPTPMPFSEVYSGLQLNTIEGHENPMFYINQNNMYEVQDYILDSKHTIYVVATLINPAFYESLPNETKAIFDEALAETNEYAYKIEKELNGNALEEIIDKNPDINVITLSPEERAKFEEAAKSVRDEYIQMLGENGEKILNTLLEEVESIK